MSPTCDSLRDSGQTCLAVACGGCGLWGLPQSSTVQKRIPTLDPMVFTGVFLSPIHWGQVSPLGQ